MDIKKVNLKSRLGQRWWKEWIKDLKIPEKTIVALSKGYEDYTLQTSMEIKEALIIFPKIHTIIILQLFDGIKTNNLEVELYPIDALGDPQQILNNIEKNYAIYRMIIESIDKSGSGLIDGICPKYEQWFEGMIEIMNEV